MQRMGDRILDKGKTMKKQGENGKMEKPRKIQGQIL